MKIKQKLGRICLLTVALVSLFAREATAGVVTNTADSGPGSLRQLIATAAPGDTITFATNLSGSVIALTGGQLTLTNNLAIDASALVAGIQIFGVGSRVFNVASTAAVTLTALTVTGGNDQTHFGGGGIYNGGFLNLNRCAVTGNVAFNTMANCGGGGIFSSNLLFVNQCTISGNHSDNDTAAGGGGGGIYNASGILFVNQSTIAGNYADYDTLGGGGIYIGNGMVTVFNSIVAANSAMNGAGGDMYSSGASIDLSGANIIQDLHGNYSGSIPIAAFPQLAVLGNYGGPTPTMPPQASSLAINACFNTDNFTNDQRGVPRILGGISDIGSVELAPPTVATLPATAAVNTNATLNATVNPNALAAAAWFQWGVTNNPYLSQTAAMAVGSGSMAQAFSNSLTSLTPGIVYHCRVGASNVDGLAYGSDVLFGSPPIVMLVGMASVTNECHTVFTDPGATNSIGLPVTVTGLVNPNSPNLYQLTYTATNSLGLSGSAIRLVSVVDTTPPVITVMGANPLVMLTNTPFVDPGATALDACGGAFAVTTNGAVTPAIPGTYTLTYSATDSYGNTGMATRTVMVRSHSVFVTTTNDGGDGSLRQAIASAFAGDDIQFATNLSGATILLTNGGLSITESLAVDGSALAGGIQINGNGATGIFIITSATNAPVALTALTITNGFINLTFGAGAVYNSGLLALNQCTLAGNHEGSNVTVGAAAICNYQGTLTINQCTLTGNHADAAAGNTFPVGGICNYGGTLTVNQCTLASNSAAGGFARSVAGLYNLNSSGIGLGNIGVTYGVALVNQSTVIGNNEGGIENAAYMVISNSIVAENSPTSSTGADLYFSTETGDLSFGGANIIPNTYEFSQASGPVPITADPHLAPLANYGGPTQTCPPLPGSPAIDACSSSSFITDQRGFPRVLGAAPDIGSVEGVYNPNGLGKLTGMTRLGNGTVQFIFTNYTDGFATVLASTNMVLPLSLWTSLGAASESPIGSGQFHFTDPQTTNFPQRFYRVRIP